MMYVALTGFCFGVLTSVRFQMSVLVEQQDETIHVIETTAATVEKDTELGSVNVSAQYG